MAKKPVETPLMKQYFEMKAKYPDAVLLFRVGDFYELFAEDAIKASKILGITLTKRANGAASYVELAGFPHHAVETYMPKLILAGQRVAICEQLEDPKKTKKIVKRGVTELITPGVALSDNVLKHSENNFLAAIHLPKNNQLGIAFLDISTGEFILAEGDSLYINKLLSSFKPKEVIYDKSKAKRCTDMLGDRFYSYPLSDWIFTDQAANERLLNHFGTKSLKGFGVEKLQNGVVAAGAILEYLKITKHTHIAHINTIKRLEENKYVWLDDFTIKNLELFHSFNPDGKALIDVLDQTATPMGARCLKRWLAMPLISEISIKKRHALVAFFIQNKTHEQELSAHINQIGDLERLASKIASTRINPRELLQLKNALDNIEPIKKMGHEAKNESFNELADQLNTCEVVRAKIAHTIHHEAPTALNKGKVIADGVSEELDQLREIAYSGKDYLTQMCQKLTEETGISSLKVGFNNVFGYYFEVRNVHKDKVPAEWVRKQTLTSAERYINQELKDYETKILGAEEQIASIEFELYSQVLHSLAEYIPTIQLNSNLVAQLDCLLSFALVAQENRYTQPEINDGFGLEIEAGRHPVIEQQLPVGESYISNDTALHPEKEQIIIITGPNMAGKSALLRQTALICIMAQIGSFAPVDKAKLGIVDRVFTRVGASDNISLGESTFMVEMNEAANILNNLTPRSLVLLDELGRGTSTYDGISIAWALTEYIHEHPAARAKTMFATHYHELNELEKRFARIKNYNVSVKEIGEGAQQEKKILFLRKLIPGGSNHSFGIHVAKIAGMPKSVINRAHEVLSDLERSKESESGNSQASPKNFEKKQQPKKEGQKEGYQVSLFEFNDPLLIDIKAQIEDLDLDNTTPVEALNKLSNIKSLLTGKKPRP